MRSKTEYAQHQTLSAPLALDFGLTLATRWFGAEALANLPLFAAGPHKGRRKGFVRWKRTVTAGYSPYVDGGVKADKVVRAWIAGTQYSTEDEAFTGMWLGRIQSLCGSRYYLGPVARDREARQQARSRADAAELAAEWSEEARGR